jgi:hypothetical protein
MVRKKRDIPPTKMPEGVKRCRRRGGDVGDTQHGQEGEGHAIEGVERKSGEGKELRRCKKRFRRKGRRIIFLQRGNGQCQMRREKRKDRNRGSSKVRLESGKIVFNSGHREARGCQELKKSE